MIQDSSTQLISADGVLGVSGRPTRVFSMHIISSGGGAAAVSLRAGTAVSGTIDITETGTTSKGVTFMYGTQGFFFPTGCFVDVDANTTSVFISYNQNT